MPHDNKPHWAIRFKNPPDRFRKKHPDTRFLLQCVLYRSNHLKAPLVKYKMLCDIFSDKLDDDHHRRWFWGVINQGLAELSNLVDAENQERLRQQIERRIPKPSAHLDTAVYRRPRIGGVHTPHLPEEIKQSPPDEASTPLLLGLGSLGRRNRSLKSLALDLLYNGSEEEKESKQLLLRNEFFVAGERGEQAAREGIECRAAARAALMPHVCTTQPLRTSEPVSTQQMERQSEVSPPTPPPRLIEPLVPMYPPALLPIIAFSLPSNNGGG